MKFFILFSLCIACSLAEYTVKTHEDLIKFRGECVKELNIPASHVEQFKKLEFPNDSVTQCYIKCVFTKFGLFDTENGYNVELVHQQLTGGAAPDHNDAIHEKIVACIDKNEQGSNACEWAYRGGTCIIKNNAQLVQARLKPAEN